VYRYIHISDKFYEREGVVVKITPCIAIGIEMSLQQKLICPYDATNYFLVINILARVEN
jgi:hypothetical protein